MTTERFDPLRRAVGKVLAADRRRRSREQQLPDAALPTSHLRALFVLTQQHAVTIGTLAKEADLNPASATAMVDQLETRGLVERGRDARDRRQCWISLTEQGRAEVERKEREYRAQMAVTFADITPDELAAATKVLERLASAIETAIS
jgi:MarR family transcriptional regulator, transcriptional regulator for hemolysin